MKVVAAQLLYLMLLLIKIGFIRNMYFLSIKTNTIAEICLSTIKNCTQLYGIDGTSKMLLN